MKQILQDLGKGETLLAEVPCPGRGTGSVLIQTSRTLVSLGTEKMLIDFGKGGYLKKARAQPDKVKQVLQKVKTDGLLTTIDAVRAKLDTPIPMGYCNVGRVIETGPDSRFAVGDRVISNGHHAEFVSVAENLVAKVPDDVDDEIAAYTIVSAIGLQGIRVLQPTLGERIVVMGLGLIGLLVVQLLRANGCQVLGMDFDARKLALAKSFGAEVVDLGGGQDPVRAAEAWTGGRGVDGVLITASAETDAVVHQAATMCRKRGRIVLVGVVGLNLRRSDFYEKELTFQVSCSYGPGRYDPNYEKRGLDYPIGFVRWTEQRNFEAVLELMRDARISVQPLTTHRIKFADALNAYEAISQPGTLGVLLEYPDEAPATRQRTIRVASLDGDVAAPNFDSGVTADSGMATVAFIGAGGFTTRMLLPKLPANGLVRHTVVSSTGASAAYAARKFGFQFCSSDSQAIFSNEVIDVVFITTPHHTHADLVVRAVESGKDVFVEKPLAMNLDELARIESCLRQHPRRRIAVGFNRRFSSHTEQLESWLRGLAGTKSVVITVNAGAIPAEHWTQDRRVGGGRIIGEACHFIDLARHLVGHPIADVTATPMAGGDGKLGDCATIQLSFTDGSVGSVHYLANGAKSFPKERIEVFAAGQVGVIENFKCTRRFGERGRHRTLSQDKGHRNQLAAFFETVYRARRWLIPLEQLVEVSRVTIEADRQIREKLVASS